MGPWPSWTYIYLCGEYFSHRQSENVWTRLDQAAGLEPPPCLDVGAFRACAWGTAMSMGMGRRSKCQTLGPQALRIARNINLTLPLSEDMCPTYPCLIHINANLQGLTGKLEAAFKCWVSVLERVSAIRCLAPTSHSQRRGKMSDVINHSSNAVAWLAKQGHTIH